MKQLLKKAMATGLCAALLILPAACGQKTDTPSGSSAGNSSGTPGQAAGQSVTLSIMGNAGDLARPYMDKALKLYEEKTGNKLDIQGIPGDNFEQVSATKFNTGDIPDIFMSFGKNTLKKYAPETNFVDFSDAKWVSDIDDTVIGQTQYNGKVWGLPLWEASVTGFFYNREIFEKHSIKAPTTQAEFMAVCQQLKDAGVNPLYMGFQDTWPLLNQVAMDPIFASGDNLEKINQNQIQYADIPQMTSMMAWYKEMADKGYLGETYATNTYDYGVDAMANGEYAMIFIWDTWLYTDLNAKYAGVADKFSLMPAFMGTTEEGSVEGPNASLLLVNKNSKNTAAAVEFIEFMANPENYNVAFDGVHTAPVFKGQTTIQTTPQYKEAKESGLLDRVLRPSSTWGSVIGYNQGDTAKATQDIMMGNTSIEDGLRTIDDLRISIAKAQQAEGFK